MNQDHEDNHNLIHGTIYTVMSFAYAMPHVDYALISQLYFVLGMITLVLARR